MKTSHRLTLIYACGVVLISTIVGYVFGRLQNASGHPATLFVVVLGILVFVSVASVIVARFVNQPLEHVLTRLDGIRRNDLVATPESHFHGAMGPLVAAVGNVEKALREQSERNQAVMQDLWGSRWALDVLSSPVCFADTDGMVLYINRTMHETLCRDEASFREETPSFQPDAVVGGRVAIICGGDPDAELERLHRLDVPGKSRLKLGGRSYDVLVAPVHGEDGHRIGSIGQWIDVHEQALVEREVNSIIGAASVGNFGGRIDLAGKHGFHRQLSESVNRLLDASETSLKDVGRVMGAIAGGDLTQKMNLDYESGALDLTQQFKNYFPGRFSVDKDQRVQVKGSMTPSLFAGRQLLNSNFDIVDHFTRVTGSVATIFVRDGSDFVRVTTSVRNESGERVIGTKLDPKHTAYTRNVNSENFLGMATLFGKDYMTCYEPVSDESGAVIGIVFIGFDMSAEHNLFTKLRDDLSETVVKLTEIIGRIKDATVSIHDASREISAGNNNLSERTERQASSLEETASSLEELTSTVKQNAENARQANHLAIGASDVAIKGGQVVNKVVETMSSINSSSKRIVDIIGVMDGIAFQTNILALNAAVEAARAGEQGRGFAVVATEVRNLAQRSTAAAKEIKELIGDSVGKVSAGAKLVDEAGQTMADVVESVKSVTDIMAQIAAASAEQSAGIEQVNQAITQMDEVTQQNAALVEQAAAAAESLEDQAQGLSQAMAIFKVEESTASNPTTALAERRSPERATNVARIPAPKSRPAQGSGSR